MTGLLLILRHFGIVLMVDAFFIGLCIAAVLPLALFKTAAYAVLKRNFVGYFSNPTGYVFLCLFVLLSSFAAFWPHEFFNSNLANLAQLNYYFPFIMLVFIPAITMSIWAEERRQGTDELLLTIPAGDLDIVLGKYLAAAAIFTASLLFSQLSNFLVLISLALGDLDTGLFLATYAGYWLMGLAMLAVGMVASFLTSNLTVGFILGAVFNAPLAFFAVADVIVPSQTLAQGVSRWSYTSQFADFGRGVIGLASTSYFLMIVGLCLYLSMVLIGRRHWLGGRDGRSMLGHFVFRAAAFLLMLIGASLFFFNHEWFRYDATSEKISSLSPDTIELIRNLKSERPIMIEAFISASVPESYVKTKVDLTTMLREFEAMGRGKIKVNIYDQLEPFSDAAAHAEEQYGINAETVMTRSRGAIKQEEVFMGAAFTCGLEQVVVPFFDYGIPVEYELIRSIRTVDNDQRLKLGILRTDAELFGGFDFQRMAPRPKQVIVEELEKQYNVVEVDPNEPIEEGAYDALMVVQPSSLTPPQLDNLITAIRNGQPTALFEDPFPVALNTAPGTGEPKRPRGGGMMMMQQQPPEPKGDIRKLWSLLGIEMVGEEGFGGNFDADIVWQKYNPYPKVRGVRQISDEWVFVSPDEPGAKNPLNSAEPIVSKLNQLLFLFPGAIEKTEDKGFKFTELVTTGTETGTIKLNDLRDNQIDPRLLDFKRKPRFKNYVLAAHITGPLEDAVKGPSTGEDSAKDKTAESAEANENGNGTGNDNGDDDKNGAEHADEDKSNAERAGKDATEDAKNDSVESSKTEDKIEPAKKKQLNVVYVTDIDLMHSDFLSLRARPDSEINWQFDNVTFVLNIIDVLAGETDFVEIRKRQTRHSTLKMVEARTEEARDQANEAVAEFESEFNNARTDAETRLQKASKELQKKVDELRAQSEKEGQVNSKELEAAMVRLAMQQRVEQRRLDSETEFLRRERDHKLKKVERDLDMAIRNVQTEFKLWAVILPPIPPLVVGLVVFLRRRSREREGVAQSRLR